MDKVNCSLIEDLMPLYYEGEVSEETKKIIEGHFSDCSSCKQNYSHTEGNIFEGIEAEEPEVPKEKKFLMRAKRFILALCGVLVLIIASSTVMSYEVGKRFGVYGERFRIAEEKNLFVDINQERVIQGSKVTLEKALLDNSITSLIVKTDYDINSFDSIILKDDKENYFPKVHMFHNAAPSKYQRVNGYSILNFKPVSKDAVRLKLELVKWKTSEKLVFEFGIPTGKRYEDISEYKNVFKSTISGIGFSVDKVILGASQSEIYCTFNRNGTDFDGIALGWYYKDMIGNRDKLLVKDSESNSELNVLSIEDVTHENPKVSSSTDLFNRNIYRFILNPFNSESSRLKLRFEELYGYYNLGNKEFNIDFGGKSRIDLSKELMVNDLHLVINSAVIKGGKIELNYQVKDKQGKKLDGYLLDARMRPAEDVYAVPREGRVSVNNQNSIVTLEAGSEKKYVISLARLGLKTEVKDFDIELK